MKDVAFRLDREEFLTDVNQTKQVTKGKIETKKRDMNGLPAFPLTSILRTFIFVRDFIRESVEESRKKFRRYFFFSIV